MFHTDRPFALLRREGHDGIEYLTGPLESVDRLGDLPIPSLAVVPYRQVRERGFECVDDNAPLLVLRIEERRTIDAHEVPTTTATAPTRIADGAFDIDDRRYANTVREVLSDEIGRGEGSNFVIHRVFEASVEGDPLGAALSVFRRLLADESGAYWTFLVHTVDRTFVGATPERHVSVEDGLVLMNPISGTYRHEGATGHREGLLHFLADRKEIDELNMVLDEELKMMATVAGLGGQVLGPYLKEMAHLTHTEYLLAGRTGLDVRKVLRHTMFAPTVVGSPIENACRVVARHEKRGRGYYGGVLALLDTDPAGRPRLDAPILIRTVEFTAGGAVRVPVGATLVRDSTPEGEVAETYAKAGGVLSALGLTPGAAAHRPAPRLADDPEIQAALVRRNDTLAPFWLHERDGHSAVEEHLRGRRVLVVDGEDTFTGMLTHQFRVLGLDVELRQHTATGPVDDFDLVVAGPGPGDPRADEPKMARLRALVHARLASRRPLLGVCLGHQLLAGALGLRLRRKAEVYQGVQREIDFFGRRTRVGFYSTFAANCADDWFESPYGPVRVSRNHDTGDVHALRGTGFAGVQFHAESVLSEHGIALLRDVVTELLGVPAQTV